MGVRWEYDGSTVGLCGSTMEVRWEYSGSVSTRTSAFSPWLVRISSYQLNTISMLILIEERQTTSIHQVLVVLIQKSIL